MNITLDAINSAGVSDSVYVLVLVASFVVAILATLGYRSFSEYPNLFGQTSCFIFPLVLGVFAITILSTWGVDRQEQALIDAIREQTGGTVSIAEDVDWPRAKNVSAAVTFTPEEGPARTCVLSTDDVKYTMTCPTSDVVEVVLD